MVFISINAADLKPIQRAENGAVERGARGIAERAGVVAERPQANVPKCHSLVVVSGS